MVIPPSDDIYITIFRIFTQRSCAIVCSKHFRHVLNVYNKVAKIEFELSNQKSGFALAHTKKYTNNSIVIMCVAFVFHVFIMPSHTYE